MLQNLSSLFPYIISPIIAAITSIIVFKLQTQRQRNEQRQNEARKIYSDFLDDFIDGHIDGILDNEDPSKCQQKKKLLQLRTKLFLYGNKSVLKAWVSFVKSVDKSTSDNGEDWYEEECRYITQLLIAMKADVSGEKCLPKDEIDQYFNPMKRL